ncbi:hypothetical protein [Cryptosporangium phraense]|uniref:Uncharacterized protein n=1 Tax=Cryptosporangium phraense TaxID=2593070 RepID=A0A545AMF5_9ACTN|nr:hypothetical protein [Cryptosporangium phraense]TQS42503.1 hypothetical protein FL583_24725 [Cryptosporangium phraense]
MKATYLRGALAAGATIAALAAGAPAAYAEPPAPGPDNATPAAQHDKHHDFSWIGFFIVFGREGGPHMFPMGNMGAGARPDGPEQGASGGAQGAPAPATSTEPAAATVSASASASEAASPEASTTPEAAPSAP